MTNTNKMISLAPDCCCFAVLEEGNLELRVVLGGNQSLKPSSIQIQGDGHFPVCQIPATAVWKSRWVIFAFPHGRAFIFELTHRRLSLVSGFECPVNTSAVVILADAGEESCNVIFGTDEGPKSSSIHAALLTFSSETLSLKLIKSWAAPGGISSLAVWDDNKVVMGFTSRNGVMLFDPLIHLNQDSPDLGTSRRQYESVLAESSEIGLESPFSDLSLDDSSPVHVYIQKNTILGLSDNGQLTWSTDINEIEIQKHSISLGFDVLGLEFLPASAGIIVCGWRGEVAIIDTLGSMIAKFVRHPPSARVDGFCVTVSSDSRILLLQTSADETSRVDFADIGRLALTGSATFVTEQSLRGHSLKFSSVHQVGNDKNQGTEDLKQALNDAWETMVADDPA